MSGRKQNTKDSRISFRLTEKERDSLEKAKDAFKVSTISDFIRKATYWQILRLESMARLKKEGIPEGKLEEAEIRLRFLETMGDYLVKYAKEEKWEEMKRVEGWMKETIKDEAKVLKEVWKRHLHEMKKI